jgi:hypothetical protein
VACIGPVPPKKPIVYGDLRGLWVSDDVSLPDDMIDDFYRSADEFDYPK